MSEEDQPSKKSPNANRFALIFTVAGIVGFQAFAPQFFGERTGGINFSRMIWAGIVGGGAALLGYGLGVLLDKKADN